MKCLPCGFEGEAKEFGELSIASGGWAVVTGRLPPPIRNVGSVEVYVCPNCGALHSDMRKQITDKSRHPN